ncbi:MAG: hypothetical protein WC048_02335 [Rhizobium sp.]
MTPVTSNIIRFPISRVLAPIPAPPVQSCAGPAFFTRTSNDNIHGEDHAAHVAAIVRVSIGFARSKGSRLDSLPPQLRCWLVDLCDKGDPTCRTVHDWLSGNSRFRAAHSGEDA